MDQKYLTDSESLSLNIDATCLLLSSPRNFPYEIKMDKYRPYPSMISMFTSDSQHPPRSRHAVHLGAHSHSSLSPLIANSLSQLGANIFGYLKGDEPNERHSSENGAIYFSPVDEKLIDRFNAERQTLSRALLPWLLSHSFQHDLSHFLSN